MTETNKYIKNIKYGKVCGDECHHEVWEIVGEPTLKEFIDEVVKDEKEWGYIGIIEEPYVLGHVFGYPNIEYRWGKLLEDKIEGDIKSLYNKKVVRGYSHGGWSNMDYWLELK